MKSVVGVFRTPEQSRQGIAALHDRVPSATLRVLTPEASADELQSVPTDDAEPTGMGAATGGVVGVAAGLAAATAVVPPAGLISVIGIAAGALLGAGGGMLAGNAIEESGEYGLPKDDLFVYADALRQGRTVVVAEVGTDGAVDDVRRVMDAAGAESVDAARDQWWLGLRDGEAASYRGGDFARDEPRYRQGFEAACRGDHPSVQSLEDAAFRSGFERGQAHRARQLH